MVHQKEDFIIQDKKYYRCICADKEFAIFARVTPHKKDSGYKTNLTDLFVTGQTLLTTILKYSRFHRGKFTLSFPNPKDIQISRERKAA